MQGKFPALATRHDYYTALAFAVIATPLWGQLRAPATVSPAQIQRQVGAAWRTVATVRRGAGGFFRWTGTLPHRSLIRLQAGPVVGAPVFVR